jgi:hypothetical protein
MIVAMRDRVGQRLKQCRELRLAGCSDGTDRHLLKVMSQISTLVITDKQQERLYQARIVKSYGRFYDLLVQLDILALSSCTLDQVNQWIDAPSVTDTFQRLGQLGLD